MGCQNKIVNLIVQQQGDYVIALKKNQGNLPSGVEQLFKEAIFQQFEWFLVSKYSTRESGHGRE